MTFLARATFALLLLTAVPACGDSGDPTLVEPVPTGTLMVTLLPTTALVAPGGSGSVGLSLTRGNGFSGPVQLSASGVPAGVSITFATATLPDGQFSTSVNITVAGTVAASSAPVTITIRASGGGVTSVGSELKLRTA